jgi:hypothetical protein
VSKKYDQENNKKRTKKGCMPLCHSPRNFVSKVVSIKWNRIIGEEEKSKPVSRGQKKKRQFEGEVH